MAEILRFGAGRDTRVREDHPGAESRRCSIPRPHEPHAYGAIVYGGGLAYWCEGKA